MLSAWGDGDGVAQVVEFIVEKIALNLTAWQGEAEVVGETVKALTELTHGKGKRRVLLNTQPLWSLASAFCEDESPLTALPPDLQMHIAKAVCHTCSAASSVQEQNMFLVRLLEPCGARFAHLVSLPDFTQSSQQPEVRRALLRALCILRGIVQATDKNSASTTFDYLQPHLEPLQLMLPLFSRDAEVSAAILDCYIDMSNHWLSKLPDEEVAARAQLLTSCFNIIEAWSGANLASERATEQEVIDGLVAILSLLQALSSE